ncbi:MAG: ABC transporter permease, partial [Rhizobiaceae bacterium]
MMNPITRRLKRLAPQLIALAIILGMITAIAPGFLTISVQNGRVYGSLIDILVRAAPVALLTIGMTLVIATRGIDLSIGAVIAICGAVAATLIADGYPIPVVIVVSLGIGLVCGLWNGILVALLDIQPIIATLILMVAGRGIAQLITEGVILTFNDDTFSALGSGSFAGIPIPIFLWLGTGLLVGLLVRRSALGFLIEAT